MKTNNYYKIRIFTTIIQLVLFLFITSCSSSNSTVIDELTVEYLNNPVGMDIQKPRFSWKIISDQRDIVQTAYQIIVSDKEKGIGNENSTLWDSGIMNSNRTVNIEYGGKTLESNKNYYWKVKVWLDSENDILSNTAQFTTGILNEHEWHAKWITTEEEIIHESPLFRKEFEVRNRIEQALLYVTAAGFYNLYLNNNKVGDHVLDPGITDYRKTILYSTYDVTSEIKKGKNAVGVMLGNGAWNMRKTQDRWSWHSAKTYGNPSLFMQLVITHTDGSKSIITSDESWKTGYGAITYNSLYGGEDYDARKEQSGWAGTGFDDSEWQFATITDDPGGKLKSQLMPPIKILETITPIASTNPAPGVFLYDLGQNIAGWWRLEVKGEPGQVIRIRGAETLSDSLFPKQLEETDRISTKFKYHANALTNYTLKGSGMETYEPSFFYTGFRYIEVVTSDSINPAHLKIEGRVAGTAVERNGTFVSSDSLLNQIHTAGIWSQKGNLHSYPTDCPHREKGAYNGDGQVIAETSMHDFHMASFYTKWVNDMRDSQQENGRIPNTSPVLVGGMGGGVAWGSAYILIPWWMYNYYNDTRILEEHYSNMKEYVAYLKELGTKDEDPSEPYIIDYFDGYWYSLGEWCAPDQRDCPIRAVVNTFYYYYNCVLLSEIASRLGYDDDSNNYRNLSDIIKDNFNRRFFNPETGLYGTEESYQTYQLLALVGDLVPEGYKEKVFETVTNDIRDRGNHLNTGIIGTKYLWPVLVKGGENQLAYEVATQTTYPSYGFWLNNGSTTLLEDWDGRASHNHQMFGSITEYFYKFLSGIQSPMEGNTTIGYSDIYIKPYIPDGLKSVHAKIETNSGNIVSHWSKEGNILNYEVNIPANSTATLALPISISNEIKISENDQIIWNQNDFTEGISGIHEMKIEDQRMIIKLGSGKYNFKVE